MFGEIVAAEIRLTLGVAVVCCEKLELLLNPVGVVKENVYDLPFTPGGTDNVIWVGDIEVILIGRFLVPVVNEALL